MPYCSFYGTKKPGKTATKTTGSSEKNFLPPPQVEFGKATDSGYWDGKVIERVRNPYLKRYKVEAALAAVQSSHQRAAFVMNAELGHSLQTQGGGELRRFTKPGMFICSCYAGGNYILSEGCGSLLCCVVMPTTWGVQAHVKTFDHRKITPTEKGVFFFHPSLDFRKSWN